MRATFHFFYLLALFPFPLPALHSRMQLVSIGSDDAWLLLPKLIFLFVRPRQGYVLLLSTARDWLAAARGCVCVCMHVRACVGIGGWVCVVCVRGLVGVSVRLVRACVHVMHV